MSGNCVVCGAEPAVPLVFRQVTGFAQMRKDTRQEGRFCRECGRSVGRRYQSRTLATGWWGFTAVDYNLYSVVANTVALVKLRALPPPRGGDPRARWPAGRPVFLRLGMLVPAGVAAVLVAMI